MRRGTPLTEQLRLITKQAAGDLEVMVSFRAGEDVNEQAALLLWLDSAANAWYELSEDEREALISTAAHVVAQPLVS